MRTQRGSASDIFKRTTEAGDNGPEGTYDRIGAGIRRPFVERVHAVVSRNVLLDELFADRFRVHPLAEPCGGNRMECDVFRKRRVFEKDDHGGRKMED